MDVNVITKQGGDVNVGDSVVIGGCELFLIVEISESELSDEERFLLINQYEDGSVVETMYKLTLNATDVFGNPAQLTFMSTDNILIKGGL